MAKNLLFRGAAKMSEVIAERRSLTPERSDEYAEEVSLILLILCRPC
jgi:hypothetical protein